MVGIIALFKDTVGVDGTPGASTNVDSLGPPMVKLKTNDNTTIDNIDTVPIPNSGSNFSYWSSLFFKCTFAPDTQIDNFQIYTDGTPFPSGITLWLAEQFPAHTSVSTAGYVKATGTPGTTGNDMDGGHAGVSSKVDLFDYIVSATFSGPTIGEAGSIINAVDETTNYFIIQAEVDDTNTSGNHPNESLFCLYDEI